MDIPFADPVLTRRSIRRYTSRPVDNEQIHLLLCAAMSAPSAEDERPWYFVVALEAPLRLQLSEVSAFTHIVKDAPAAIIVCGDESLQKQVGCWVLDCAAATENILIEANHIGLGAVWLGIYPVEGRIQKVRAILSLPKNIVPFAIVPIGHPAEKKEPRVRFDKQKVHVHRAG